MLKKEVHERNKNIVSTCIFKKTSTKKARQPIWLSGLKRNVTILTSYFGAKGWPSARGYVFYTIAVKCTACAVLFHQGIQNPGVQLIDLDVE